MFAALVKSSVMKNQGAAEKRSTEDSVIVDLVAHGKSSSFSAQPASVVGNNLNKLSSMMKQNNSNNNNNVGSVPLTAELSQTFQIIEWDPEIYGVGVRSIDEQHQQLVATMAKLCQLGRQVGTLSLVAPNIVHNNANSSSNNNSVMNNKTGGGGGADSLNRSSSPSSPARGSVTSPMSLRGALGLDTKVFKNKNDGVATTSGGDAAHADDNEDPDSGSTRKKSATSAVSIKDAGTKSDEEEIQSAIHVFGHRVTLPEGGFRTIDRGHPLELQRGGRIEPILDALVHHCSVRLIQEEHAFEAVSFSDRVPHGLEHQIFVREVFRAYQLMEQSNFELNDLVRLVKFLKAWIKDHIPKDRRYAPLMIEKQAQMAAGKV